MILAVDAGNTNIVLGCLEGREISAVARLTTDAQRTEYEYAVLLRESLRYAGVDCDRLEGGFLSSVVWPLTETLRRAIKLVIGREPLVVGKGLKTGLDIRLDDPGQIGSDLVVGAVAALELCAPPLIVIDMGTATTFSALDDRGRFAGGVIAPGIWISQNALSGGTSQLPRISLDAPRRVIGTNTVASMQSGAIYGAAAMLDGMIDRIAEELGGSAGVIATGGLSSLVVPYCRREIRLEPDLLLRGLGLLWEKNRR